MLQPKIKPVPVFYFADETGDLVAEVDIPVVLSSDPYMNFEAIQHVDWVVERGHVLRSPN